MPQHRLGPRDALPFDHRAPTRDGGVTLVLFNALTGDSVGWERRTAPALRGAGHGTLAWNYRGRTDSPFSPDLGFSAGRRPVAPFQAIRGARRPRPGTGRAGGAPTVHPGVCIARTGTGRSRFGIGRASRVCLLDYAECG